MRDYMRALHLRFKSPSRQAQELEQKITVLHKQLATRLAKSERRVLLRLVDLENALRSQTDLDSFLSGSGECPTQSDGPGQLPVRVPSGQRDTA